MKRSPFAQLPSVLCLVVLLVAGCGGGGGGGEPTVQETAPPAPPPVAQPLDEMEAVRFLSQATFGPSPAAVDELVAAGLEQWFLDQLERPPTLHLQGVLARLPPSGRIVDDNGMPLPEYLSLPSDSFWRAAIEAPDQLRQRMAFALSQILVVSADSMVGLYPQAMAYYMDVLTRGAFGNYRDLLEAVTYSPAMAGYLTYLRNEKADPVTGRVPDENYARELLQLFTIGLVELNPDGTAVTGAGGTQVELFDNGDITELAKVFTGLSLAGAPFDAPLRLLPPASLHTPLEPFDSFHSPEPKTFLGVNIPAGTGASDSIALALDGILAHANVGPFIGRQLIQRFVTSAPEPAYVARVSAAFDLGRFTLPSGTAVGTGRRGDLDAVIAAVLFDPEARGAAPRERPAFGKLREPVLRFTHWARAFEVDSADAANEPLLRNTAGPERLGQHPYRAPSVFNFYRPGYVAPGTSTGAAQLTAPELQITNATSIVGYPNFLTIYAFEQSPRFEREGPAAFTPDYGPVAALEDTAALLDYLDRMLTHGTLREDSRQRIAGIVDALDANTAEGRLLRARVASVLVMSSPEYIVLR